LKKSLASSSEIRTTLAVTQHDQMIETKLVRHKAAVS